METLNLNIDNLSENQKIIADYIKKNAVQIPYMSIEELASDLNTSTASISRFCRDSGFKSFKELKERLKDSIRITPASKVQDILSKINEDDITTKLISSQITYLQETLKQLSAKEFARAVDAIVGAGVIYAFGPGPAECLVQMLRFRLSRFGMNVVKMQNSGSELLETLMHAKKGDLVIIFGFMRKLPETGVILEHAKTAGYTTLLITDLMVSEMIDSSDITLYACRGSSREFHSMVTSLAIVDSLVVAVASRDEKKALEKLDNLHNLRKRFSSQLPR